MKKIDLLSIPVYSFQGEDSLVDAVYEVVTNLDFHENGSNEGYMFKNFYHEKLFDWFDSCIKQVSDIYYHHKLTFPITGCWANKTTTGRSHFWHSHPNCIIAGVFYLTTHNTSKTVFDVEDPWHDAHRKGLLISGRGLNQNVSDLVLKGSISPEKGKLVLFPSKLNHMVEFLTDDDNVTRYSIAFNTYAKGVICQGPVTSMLELNPVSVREL